MTAANPLVAQRQSSTNWHSGISIVDDAAGVFDGVSSGSWIEGGLGVLGVGLDTAVMAANPLATLISYGLNFLIEHVQPLQDALNKLAGDPDQISAYSQTWKNISQAVGKAAQDYTDALHKDTANWSGATADAYQANATAKINALTGAATAANTIGTVVEVVGVLVGVVRGLVRDMVTQAVGQFIQDALEEVGTLGLGTPMVIAQVVSQVSDWMDKIAGVVRKLTSSLEKLKPLMSKLEEIWSAIKKALGHEHGVDGEPHTSTTPSDATAPSSAHEPSTTEPSSAHEPASTEPSSAEPPATEPSSTGDPSAPTEPSSTSDPSLRDGSTNPADTAQRPIGRCGRREPIDAATGEMFMVQTDLELPGVLPLTLARTHVSSYRAGRYFGPSWSSTLDQRLEIDAQGVCYAGPAGTILVYPTPPVDGSVLPSHGARWPLARTPDGGYLLSQPENGQTLRFGPTSSTVTALSSISDRNGNRVDFDYDPSGTLTGLRHSGGYRVAVATTGGLVTELRLAGAAGGQDVVVAGYRYDEHRRLTEVVNSSGQAKRFDYDADGRITAWTGRTGEWYRYQYDASGRCVRTDGAGGALAGSLSYDPVNRVTVETDSLGNATTLHFNELHQLVREVDPLGNTTVQEWDGHERLATVTDPLGRTTRYEYDDTGNLTGVTRPDGSRALVAYNQLRLPVTVVHPDGGVRRYEYDERGNAVAVTDPAGARTVFSYDATGAVASVTDPLGQTTVLANDAAGLTVAVTDPAGAITRTTRDIFGRVATITDPTGAVTRLAWTVEGQPLSRVAPDGATERWSYDAQGRSVGVTDAAGALTRTEFGRFDLPTAEVRPDGSRLEFAYDSELRLTTVTNPQGLVWRYEYDPVGNLVRETDFNGRTVGYRYDAAGQLASRVNGVGQTVTFTRDAHGQVVERRSADGATTFAYDPAGRLLRAVSPDAELVFQRDILGQVLAETVDRRTVTSEYDALGRRVRRTTPSGAQSTWSYDANHHPVQLTTGGHTTRFGYNAAGQEIRRQVGVAVLNQTWDADHRLRSQALTTAGDTERVVQRRSYRYDTDGRLAGVVDLLAGNREFDLDPMGRITAVRGDRWIERYAYDSAGNIADAGWTAGPQLPGPADAAGPRSYSGTLLRRAGNLRYEYDQQGRVVLRQRKLPSSGPSSWHYTWDADDRLVGVTTPDGTRWRYRYDALGRRVGKLRLAGDGSVAERVDFSWDGTVLAEQAHSAGTVTTWEFDPDTYRPLTQTERVRQTASAEWVDQQFYAIVTDLVGTPTELVDADGNLAWRNQSTAWGEQVGAFGQRAYTPLRFPGQYADAETGLHYNYHRYYDPASARYSSADPLGLTAGPAPHSYVQNPTSRFDALGLAEADGLEWVDPALINFTQRTVAPNNYVQAMLNGEWDWTRPGTALRVMEVNGQLVSFDNRRLDAAREVGKPVAIQRVNPNDPYPASEAGKSWQEAFAKRRNDIRNVRAGGKVPETGVKERPTVVDKNGNPVTCDG